MPKPCGTYAGFSTHVRRGEMPCDACRQAQREYANARNRVNPRRAWTPQAVACWCGEMFEQQRWGQRYCSPEHRPGSWRSKGNTANRGYGAAHVKARKAALEALVPGERCPRCREGMWPDQELHLDHKDDRTGYLGLSHARCNLRAGAIKSNRLRGRPKQLTLPFPVSPRKRRKCACGADARKGSKFCQACADRRLAEIEERQRGPSSRIRCYTCRYCGQLKVAHGTGLQRREVCPAKECQLSRLTANNLVMRKGMTREQADRIVAAYRAEGDHRAA